MRPVGLYGRKHALIPAGLRDLTYYAAGPLPTAPASVAVPTVPNPGDGTDWGMLGNDSNHQPWDLNAIQGSVVGGHCIPIVGYDSNYLYAITWGGVQPIAYPAWARIASEAWAVITRTQVQAGNDGRGINLAALKSDLALLAA